MVVGGSGKDVGKTALVCAVIAALPEFGWTAVKITGHEYEGGSGDANSPGDSQPVIREELSASQETDTARYLAAGARRALLVTRSGPKVPIEEIRRALGPGRNVIYESNRIVEVIKPDLCLALVGDGAEKKPSFQRLLREADAVVSAGSVIENSPLGALRFPLESVDRLPAEMVDWLRERLGEAGSRA